MSDTNNDMDTSTESPTPAASAPAPAPVPEAVASTAMDEPQVAPDINVDEKPLPVQEQLPEEKPTPKTKKAKEETPAQVAPQLPPPPPLPTAADYNNHDLQFAQDLAAKKIQPKTYQDLFADKSTLGKIGTIFGLMLSGAGSGLAGQQNAMLGMMDKQIDRDLEAQKLGPTNAQNFLNLSYQHELQQAQAKRMAYENELTKAYAGKVPAEIRKQLAESAAIDAEHADMAKLNRAKNSMYSTVYNQLENQAGNNPAAQAILTNTIAPAIQQKMQQNNGQTEAQIKLNSLKQRPELPQASNTGVDIDKMQKMINFGKVAPDAPGVITPGDVGQVTKEANDVKANRNIAKVYDDSFKKLDSLALAGKLNPNLRKAEVDALAGRMSHDLGLSQDQAHSLIEGTLPDVKDYGSARAEKYRKGMEHFQGREANTATLDRYGLKTSFPEYSFKPSGQKKGSTPKASMVENGPEVKTMNGLQYEKVSGGWKRVQADNSKMVSK